jgi:4'-phosphopantetheinyl transferase
MYSGRVDAVVAQPGGERVGVRVGERIGGARARLHDRAVGAVAIGLRLGVRTRVREGVCVDVRVGVRIEPDGPHSGRPRERGALRVDHHAARRALVGHQRRPLDRQRGVDRQVGRAAAPESSAAVVRVDYVRLTLRHGIDSPVAAARACVPAERASAARLRSPEDALRHLAGRALLRRALAEHAGVDARGLAFSTGPQGRPSLPGCPVSFNPTHAGNQVWVALARGAEVGIDVERLDALPVDELPVEMLAVAERAALDGLASEALRSAFMRAWVRKEPVLKALGSGLMVEPICFVVDIPAGTGADWLRTQPHGDTADWSVCDLDAPPGYLAALALRGAVRFTLAIHEAEPFTN